MQTFVRVQQASFESHSHISLHESTFVTDFIFFCSSVSGEYSGVCAWELPCRYLNPHSIVCVHMGWCRPSLSLCVCVCVCVCVFACVCRACLSVYLPFNLWVSGGCFHPYQCWGCAFGTCLVCVCTLEGTGSRGSSETVLGGESYKPAP